MAGYDMGDHYEYKEEVTKKGKKYIKTTEKVPCNCHP